MPPRTAYLTIERDGLYRRLHASEVAERLGIAERTVRRWIRGAQQPDPHALRLLELLELGSLSELGWRGFFIDPEDGRLWSPNGYRWTQGELTHWGLVIQRAEAMRRAE